MKNVTQAETPSLLLQRFLAEAELTLSTEGAEQTFDWTLREDGLFAGLPGGVVWVLFKVQPRDGYTTFTLDAWEGIADRPGAALRLRLPMGGSLQITELDCMTSWTRGRNIRGVDWWSPSKQFGTNPPGAFAVFDADSDEAHDEILLRIWVEQDQPHQQTGQDWTLDHARSWLADWQETFASRSQMVVNGDCLQDLYDLVPYAEKAGIDEIYIFTNTWRPDPFWPMTDVNWALNPRVFPNGRADLRAYSDYLAERGIRLCLHYVSGGIGLCDPVYVGTSPHPDLACWGLGELALPLDKAQSVLRIRPGADLCWPLDERPHFNHVLIQIGTELIRPERTTPESDGLWSLQDCERGAFATLSAAHPAGIAVKFLVVPYGQNVVPDNNSDLLYEIADGYAGLLNECRITHAEFDGAEIHGYDGRYGYYRFAQRIYEQMDHAITGHDSGASAPRCFFEYRFKRSQKILRGSCGFTHGNWLVPFQIDSASRPASTLLDAHFFLSQGHWGGALGLSKPEPMFGVTPEMLKAHGLTEAFLEALGQWKALCGQLTDEQHERIEASLSQPDWPMPEASRHRVSDTVYTVNGLECGGELVPVQVMKRKTGDIHWQLGQEFGPLSPRQFVRPGEELELTNAYHGQTPEFILRVLPAYDREALTLPHSAVNAKTEKLFDDKDFFVEGNKPGAKSSGPVVRENIDLMPLGFDGRLHAVNEGGEPLYQVRDLFAYPLRADLHAHRGLGVEVEGDGSGALVLVQLEGKGGRDYVIPIDFTGLRYVEIPCGEVSWARADWGWRMGTKTMDYSAVAQIRIGLGRVPAQSRVSVRIRSLTALAEQPLALEQPCIRINDSALEVKGSIVSGHYLVYPGGDTADVFDPNWHPVDQLPLSRRDLHAEPGVNAVTIETPSPSASLWLEVQVLVKDRPALHGYIASKTGSQNDQ